MIDVNKLIELMKYFILGIVQGVTEPLPISSSGHVVIVREIFSVDIPGLTFEIIVNFGSLLAIMYVYRTAIIRLMKNFFQYIFFQKTETKDDFRYVLLIIIATIPIGIIGMLSKHVVVTELSSFTFVGISLVITGGFLWLIRHLRGFKGDEQITLRDAIIIGFVQTIALIPGISRSGATIVAAMFVGLKRDVALRFSFLLYIPVSIGVTIFSLPELTTINSLMIPLTIAWLAAIMATFFALKWFIQLMVHGKLIYFSVYCFIVGTCVIMINSYF